MTARQALPRFGGYEVHSIAEQLDLPIETAGVARTGLDVHRRPVASRDGSALFHRLLREPLCHFLLAGTLLLGVTTLFERLANADRNASRIQVSAPEIQRLREVWIRQWGRTPDSRQMQNLIDDYVREEVMYREALASGLDKDDTIVRRRMVEKMEFLSQEVASAEPSEKALGEYFEGNREKFRIPAEVAFSHIYFSTSKRGPAAEGDASRALVRLTSPRIPVAQFSGMGDPFMLQNEYPLQTQQQVKELFGDEFAGKVFQLEPGAWTGPLRSGYGFHLVRILQKLPSRVPELAAVRGQVLTDFKNHRLQTASEAFYSQLRRRYQVEVDNAALAAAASQRSTSSVNSGSQGAMVPDVD
jgi:peptidyl-prolyl cis-trans isomerase C